MSGKTKKKAIPQTQTVQQVQNQTENKPKELSKTEKSLRNILLASAIGLISFLPIWVIMYMFIQIPMPGFLEKFVSIDDWNFWVWLLLSLLMAALILLMADSVAEEKNKWTNGIAWALAIILSFWVIGYYGHIRENKPQEKKRAEIFSDYVPSNPNPFSDMNPRHLFTLNRGEKSLWIDFPAGYRMDTWGNHQYYKIIYQDGSVVTVDGSRQIKHLPDINGDIKVRFESLSDGQTIYIYLTRKR